MSIDPVHLIFKFTAIAAKIVFYYLFGMAYA